MSNNNLIINEVDVHFKTKRDEKFKINLRRGKCN